MQHEIAPYTIDVDELQLGGHIAHCGIKLGGIYRCAASLIPLGGGLTCLVIVGVIGFGGDSTVGVLTASELKVTGLADDCLSACWGGGGGLPYTVMRLETT